MLNLHRKSIGTAVLGVLILGSVAAVNAIDYHSMLTSPLAVSDEAAYSSGQHANSEHEGTAIYDAHQSGREYDGNQAWDGHEGWSSNSDSDVYYEPHSFWAHDQFNHDGYCCSQHDECCDEAGLGSFWDKLNLRLGYTSPRGIGRKPGYETIALMYCPDSNCGCFNPFWDVRLHYLNNNRWAGNFGVGVQTTREENTYRGYIYYDFRDTKLKLFNQITLGAEYLGPCFDVRGNIYLPLEQGHTRRDVFSYPGGYDAISSKTDRTWSGFDLEVSKHYCVYGYDLYASAGPYGFFASKHEESAVGGKVRLETEIYRNIGLAVQYSYDSEFHSRIYGQITWTIPLGNNSCCDTTCCIPVRREEIIVVDRQCHWKTNY